ncbi:hypothetical protein HN51_043672 [Arachis hypogaea]|uniref:TIR domain-containing protein n=1 Tax=Arachis hypogaea TaxID=3818 RepID=A0A444Y5N9_ARAHY|nr:TMV resistance protein N-like [Arachis ipaensis]XP_025673724.1 disease resistance-like protein DSC1 [Arachis hypogaea]QHN95739.1 TMV resistance protein N [Arachis hypogaea]RYQ97244.1 hypothetical protein Ahy_B08g093274 [Arachis hypogaea]
MDAIRDSRLAIVVFSETYPTSTWCLDEMSAIADRRRQKKQIVYPVFYDVTSSDVGRQAGPYKKHFNAEQMSRFPEKRVKRWRKDMKYLSKLYGFPLIDHRNRPETEHLEKIILDVAEKLKHKFKLEIKDLIGVKPRLEELQGLLKLKSEDVPFQILEIWGMSGIGKTVLGMILFDRISYQFDAFCFIQDVNHIHRTHGKGAVTEIQKQILHQIFQEKNLKFSSPPEIAKILQNRLCNLNLPKKALIVLDDVSDPKQWDDLGIDHNLLGRGSRVVITTRFKHVLNVPTSYEIYEVPLLNDEEEALKLFQTKASKIGCPNPTVHDVSRKVVEYAQSLPSAIVELGSYFNQRPEVLWEGYLERWRKYPNEGYMNSLQETSYTDLKGDEKIIFLDIACFFGGKRNKYVEHILESRISSDPHLAIQEIWRNSLIKIRNDEIHMHQILRDLGKKIVRGNNTEEPKCWSRLWDAKDFQKALNTDMQGNAVQAIVLDEDVSRFFKIERVSQMRHLRLLILHQESPSGNHIFYFNELSYLSWDGYAYASLSLSIWFNLVELNLQNSSIERLWDEEEEIPNLKRMDLSNSRNLTTTPNFVRCQGLVRLDLSGCTNLTEVHDSIQLLSKLDYLSLRNCSSLPIPDFGINCQLVSLRTLLLSGCNFRHRRPDLTRLSKLSYIDF